jgi:hypothetical protein
MYGRPYFSRAVRPFPFGKGGKLYVLYGSPVFTLCSQGGNLELTTPRNMRIFLDEQWQSQPWFSLMI